MEFKGKQSKVSKAQKRYFAEEEKLKSTPVEKKKKKTWKYRKSQGKFRKKTYAKESSEKIIKFRPKTAHGEKKKVRSHLKSLHEILEKTKPPDEEESELQSLVFGGNFEEEEDITAKEKEMILEKPVRKPVWEDKDDENILVEDKTKAIVRCPKSILARGTENYSKYVQEKFKQIVGEPEWAELGRKSVDSDGNSDDELLQTTGNFINTSPSLSKGVINIRKCSSLTHESSKGGIIKSVEFHPTSRVALVTGTNGIVNLYQVDGKINSKIQTICFDSFPVHTAHFTTDGYEIVAGSNAYGYFYTYDMLAGKMLRVPWQKGMEQRNIRRFCMSPDGKYIVIHGRYGNMHLVTSKTKEWVGSLKMNGEVVAVDFNKDGTKMYSHGDTGEVYIWDMNSRKCIHKFTDEGCLVGTSIAISPNDQFLATGSDCGIVNLYECSNINSSSPVPVKIFKNLTTEITSLKFNVTTELLTIGSSYKDGAVRMIHFPSMSAFSNFPSRDEYKTINKVNSMDISPNSGFVVMGNNLGNALLYRLKHYKNY